MVILVHKVHGLQLHNFKAILVNRSFSIQSILSQHDTVKKPVHAYARLLFLLGWNEIRSESSKRCRICNYSQMIRGNQEWTCVEKYKTCLAATGLAKQRLSYSIKKKNNSQWIVTVCPLIDKHVLTSIHRTHTHSSRKRFITVLTISPRYRDTNATYLPSVSRLLFFFFFYLNQKYITGSK